MPALADWVSRTPDQIAVSPGGPLVPPDQRIGERKCDLAVAVAVGLERDLDQLERSRHRSTVLPTHRAQRMPLPGLEGHPDSEAP